MDRLTRRDVWPVAVTVVALFCWALLSWLTIWVDADILAEAIQVQHLREAPAFVLSYPGQLYGGVLEYPLLLVVESFAKGDATVWTMLRTLYLPLVGLLACVNIRRLNPSWSLWPVALAAIAGPAVLHSLMPIKDLYPFAWLIVMGGISIVFAGLSRSWPRWTLLLGGLLIGLAGYQHPTTLLIGVPLLVVGLLRWRASAVQLAWSGIGVVLGLIPLVLALKLQPNAVVAYESAKLGGPQLLPALGLVTGPDAWASALLPAGWGFSATDHNALAFPDWLTFALSALLVVGLSAALVGCVFVAIALIRRRDLPAYSLLAALWGTFSIALIVLTAVVKPTHYYGAGLAILVWFTLAALPTVLSRSPRLIVTGLVIALMAVTSIGSLLAVEPRFPESMAFESEQVAQTKDLADAIADAGVEYVYGDYWHVLPIAYMSQGRLHVLTSGTNRFALPKDAGPTFVVAVPTGEIAAPYGHTKWTGAQEAFDLVQAKCARSSTAMPAGVVAFRCPSEFIQEAK